jgi:hypothetical protein
VRRRTMILNIILLLLFFIIFLILFAISIPYKYRISFKYDKHYQQKIHISNSFFNWDILNSEKNKDKKESDEYNYKTVKNKIDEKEEKSSSKFPFKLITKENLSHILKFLLSLYKKVKVNEIDFKFLINFEDPYYNGILLSSYYTIKGVYPNLPITIKINWEKEVSKAQGKIEGDFRPIIILYTILAFILSPRTLKILWKYYKFKKKINF